MHALFMALALLTLGWARPLHADPVNYGDGIAAIISSTVVSNRELAARARLTYRQVGEGKLTDADRRFIENKTLLALIDEEIQKQFADGVGLRVTPSEYNAYVKAVAKQVDLNALSEGGLEKTLKKKLEAEVRWQKIVAEMVRPRVHISQQEIDQIIAGMLKGRHVTEREISQIMLSVNEKSDDAAQREKMAEIAQKIANGESFADMAKQFSDDATAKEGGKMGWFASGELNPQLEDALDKLEAGQVSGVIRTPLGWHILRLDNIRTTKPMETDEENMAQYRSRVREHLTVNRVELESRRLMRDLRQRTFVDIRKPG